MRRECHLIVNCLSSVCHALLGAVRDLTPTLPGRWYVLGVSSEDEDGYVVMCRGSVYELLHMIEDGRAQFFCTRPDGRFLKYIFHPLQSEFFGFVFRLNDSTRHQ